ncbi:MAG TPA: hypothetical protein VGP42_16140 [Stellaceae bacterium]|nr:hypothetical protein [Stellaceae bacterium]
MVDEPVRDATARIAPIGAWGVAVSQRVCPMPLKMLFTPTERERLGVLVNNISFYGTQLINQTGPDLTRQALVNLAKVKKEDEVLLKRLDELTREQSEESPLRLIEDLARIPGDIAQMLTLVRRCLLASAFLGHCLAQPNYAQMPSAWLGEEKRLH